MKTDTVSAEAKRIGRKIDRIAKMNREHMALMNWEIGLLRKTVQMAAELLRGPGWKPIKRGDKTKRDHVLLTARIHKPAASPAAPGKETKTP